MFAIEKGKKSKFHELFETDNLQIDDFRCDWYNKKHERLITQKMELTLLSS